MNKDLLLLTAVACSFALLTQPASAEVFVAPFGGYSFGASEFNNTDNSFTEQGTLKIAESEHYGFMVGVTTKDPGNIYFLYSHQSSDLSSGENFSPALITDLAVDYFQIGGSLFFPSDNLTPYITASIGLTQMRPGDNFTNESRFSMGFGAGIEYKMTGVFSLFTEARGYATFFSSENTLFCDSDQCVWHIHADVMWQGQVNAGIKLTF